MIPKQALLVAKQGGFDTNGYRYNFTTGLVENWQELALNPAFFQALGKVLGWVQLRTIDRNPLRQIAVENWLEYAERFNHLILTNGDTKAFWDDLLAPQSN